MLKMQLGILGSRTRRGTPEELQHLPEELQAWRHGPVCPDVFHQYKALQSGPIPHPDGFDLTCIPQSERDVVDEVHTVYGQFSAWRLRELTHDESPWRKNYRAGVYGIVIPHEDLREFFVTVVGCS